MFGKDLTQRKITLEERMMIGDNVDSAVAPHNFIAVRDKGTGKVLFTRKNLVVRIGRELTLRHLFDLPYSSEDQEKLHNRTLCLFGIGSGGTPESDPFNPLVPTSADKDLNKAVPFRIVNSGNPLPEEDKKLYFDTKQNHDDTQYMKKLFTKKELVVDTEKDRVYVKVTLDVNALDARGQKFSEIGIFSARVTKPGETYEDIQMFSRITFDTESLSATTGKGLTIEYYVFA
ncbi:hypothetical protein [Proteus mirabilis]|uniref:hypothetical protein n=1 Tax=Proteus mirabilis TaxID=584 RepID=UPI0034D46617